MLKNAEPKSRSEQELAIATRCPAARQLHRIPKGTLLVAHIGYIHQRDDHFENPQAFQPERFLGKRPEINYYAPFGGGLHSCIGNHFAAREVRVFLKVMFGKGGFSCKRRAEREKRQTILNLPGKGVRVKYNGTNQNLPSRLPETT